MLNIEEEKWVTEQVAKARKFAAPAGYSCSRLFNVGIVNSKGASQGFIPLITLPENLVGKIVKVTIEEQI
jgi:hypothetical protein